MQSNFSFDHRVADKYNTQRAHPADVSQQIGQAIAEIASAGTRILEIGVGTGRIATPVAYSGCRVVGIDLSAEMMAAATADATAALTFVQADMHRLPFAANTFEAVTAVHVLHLATDWQQVLREVARVLKPNGVFIQGEDWVDPDSVFGRLRDELRRQAMAMSPDFKPPAAGISKADFLATLGGTTVTETVAAEWTTPLSPQQRLDLIEQRLDNESWFLPEPIFNKLFAYLQQYATKTWSDLNTPLPVRRQFRLKSTRGHW